MAMTKQEIRAWSAQIKTNSEARRKRECLTCKSKRKKPITGQYNDGECVRAVWWCPTCDAPAFGSDSYLTMKRSEIEALPVVGGEPDGT